MRLFDCSENDEAEVTNVDKENHDVEELVLTNVQSTGNRLSKTNGGMFQDMVNKKYPKFSVGLEKYSQCHRGRCRQCKLSTTDTSTCTANVAVADKSSVIPVPPRSHHISRDNHHPFKTWPSLANSWRAQNHEWNCMQWIRCDNV